MMFIPITQEGNRGWENMRDPNTIQKIIEIQVPRLIELTWLIPKARVVVTTIRPPHQHGHAWWVMVEPVGEFPTRFDLSRYLAGIATIIDAYYKIDIHFFIEDDEVEDGYSF